MKRGFRLLQFFSIAIALCVLATGASGAVVKSVQSNNQTMAATPATVNLPTQVIASNAFVICQADTGGITSFPAARATCELNATGTQLTITTNKADLTATPLTVRWYVAEFLSGVSVQRGLTTLAAGSTTTAPPALNPAVNLASSFVLVTENMNDAVNQNNDEQWTVKAQLTTTTNLQLTRNASGTAVKVAWQVIQIDSAAVQSGTTTIAINSRVATVALNTLVNPPVDPSRTFLVFSRSAWLPIAASAGEERRYQVTGQITAPNTITFTRAYQNNLPNTQVDIVWYAVRMTDGTLVQNNVCGPSGTGAASATMPAVPAGCLIIPTTIATNRSIALLSARGDDLGGASNQDLDDTSWRSTLAPAGNAIVLNQSAGANFATSATVAWQVVQFNNTTNTIDRVEVIP